MQPFSSEDLYRHRTVSSLVAGSGHARCTAFVSRAHRGKDSYVTSGWQFDSGATGSARRIPAIPSDASSPALSPDGGAIAFLSAKTRDKTRQLHLLGLDGGKRHVLTALDGTPQRLHAWSPDGNRLLLSVSVDWAEDALDDPAAGADRPRVARALPYKRDGSGWLAGRRTHLFAVVRADGSARALADGDFDVSDACWSPDGRRLAYVRTRGGRQRHVTELWIADADGGNARALVDTLASVSGPRWSPDGRRLAFAGSAIEGDSIEQAWVIDADAGGPPRRVGAAQLEGGWIAWHPDGDRIATVAVRRSLHELVVMDLDTGKATPFHAGLRHIQRPVASGDRIVFVQASMRRPEEVASVRWDGSDRRVHSRFNARWVRDRVRPIVRKRLFTVPDGDGGRERVEAWVLLPPDRAGPMPVLLDMHGGPQSVTLVDFAGHLYWYALLARGWAVVSPNPVGSGGRGGDFARRLIGRWGELDMPQHLAILDALQADGVLDPLRVACAGKSYGGYLAAWAACRTARFAAAVVSAPVANIESHAGTSDTGYYVTPYAMGTDLPSLGAAANAVSPVAHAHCARAAILLLQGEKDQRCPLGQSEELFARLVAAGNEETRMVVYPKASHGLGSSGKPSHRMDYHRRIVDWLERHAPPAVKA
jgi:dipeptidyl aminopeptidase/acylaminoacyl peptidase